MKKRIMCMMLSFAMAVASISFGGTAVKADNSVEINKTNFPDEAFRNYVSKNFDKDKNGVLHEYEMNDVTSIEMTSACTSFKGIEHFDFLMNFTCSNTGVKSIDLSNNTLLLTIKITNETKLTEVNIKNCTALEDITINARLDKIDLTDIYEGVMINKNIDLSGNNLKEIYIPKTVLSLDLSNNKFETIDISNATHIKNVDLSDNNLKKLDLRNNKEIETLNVSGNSLSVMDGYYLENIKELDCSSNGFDRMFIDKCTQLEKLNCSNNNLKFINLKSGKDNLYEIICNNNEIESLSVYYTEYGDGKGKLRASNSPKAVDVYMFSTQYTYYNNKDKSSNKDVTAHNMDSIGYLTSIEPVARKEATCSSDGYYEYYAVKDYLTKEITGYSEDQENLVPIKDINAWKKGEGKIPALGHIGGKATCTKKAVCTRCKKEYGSYAKHSTEKVAGKEPTATEDGYKACYRCKECKKYFEDSAATKKIDDIEKWRKGAGKLPKKSAKKGDKITDKKSKGKYVITSAKAGKETVKYVSPTNKSASTVAIPDTITYEGYKYKVTKVGEKAFKGNKKIKKLIIGKNVKDIGKSAFEGCGKLKNITIKTSKLTKNSVGKNAFKGLNSKAKAKVPSKKVKDYKSILKKKGFKGKNQKVTK